MTDVTRVLADIEAGDPKAAADLLPLVYDELRVLAAHKMAREMAGHTLQPTALVHEAWMRLVGDGCQEAWNSRGHFYAAAAEAMRRILIEAARHKASLKRGGHFSRIQLTDDAVDSMQEKDWDGLLALDGALARLKAEDASCYQLVMLRFFGGLTINEAAESLGVSARTAKRDWSYARAWLQREIDGMSN